MSGSDRGSAGRIAHAEILRLAAGIRGRPGNLIIVQQQLYQAIVPVPAQLRYVVDIVDGENVGLVEVSRSVVKRLVGTPIIHIIGVVVGVIKCLRIGVSNTVLEATRVAAINLDLECVVVRGTGPGVPVDAGIAAIRSQEVTVLRTARAKGVPIFRVTRNTEQGGNGTIYELRSIRKLIYVALLTQVPGERSNVTDLHYRLETYILLNADLEVINRWCFGMDFECSQRLWKAHRCSESDEVRNILDVAIVDGEGFLLWWIGA